MYKAPIKKFFFLAILLVLVPNIAFSEGNSSPKVRAKMPKFDPNITADSALGEIKGLHGNISNQKGFVDFATPVTRESGKLKTLDGKTHFEANVECRKNLPLVRVDAVKSGSELDIAIHYDSDNDGILDKSLQIGNVAGSCGNGAIVDCSPSGSWKDCKYGLLEFNNGELTFRTKYPSGENLAPYGFEDCFCFNASCGGNADLKMEAILNNFASVVLKKTHKANPSAIFERNEYKEGDNYLEFHVSSGDNCAEYLDNGKVKDTAGLYGKLNFPYQDAIAKEEKDPDSIYSLLHEKALTTRHTYTCEKRAQVALKEFDVQVDVYTPFGIGVDADGGSKQCYWFTRQGSCGQSFFETGNVNYCVDTIASKFLGSICASLYVNSGYFKRITDVQDFKRVSGFGNYASCYGSGNDGYDILTEMNCVGIKSMIVPVCKSPSKSIKGQVIYNDIYDPLKYEGCYEIAEPIDGCTHLEKRDDCRVRRVVADGVYTVVDGQATNVQYQPSCREVKGANNSFTICEPWWVKTYTYECDEEDGFEKEKKRAKHIGTTTQMNGSHWVGQGDIGFNEDGSTYNLGVASDIIFQSNAEECEPSCLVETKYANDQIYLPEQGKLTADGGYHVNYGETSYVGEGSKSDLKVMPCLQVGKTYRCPAPKNSVIKYDCTCSNADEFIQAIAALTAISHATSDFICTTGEEHGVCSGDELVEEAYRVICYKDDDFHDCSPALWRGNNLPPQTHTLNISKDYECNVVNGGGNYEPDKTFGYLKPERDWFDKKIDFAEKHINEFLQEKINEEDEEASKTCDCPGEEHKIDICQKSGNRYLCLTDNSYHNNQQSCDTKCSGKATYTKELGLCVWRGADVELQGIKLSKQYNLLLDRENEKIFGEVLFSSDLQGSVSKAKDIELAECKQKTTHDEVIIEEHNVSCTGKNINKTVDQNRRTNSQDMYKDITKQWVYNLDNATAEAIGYNQVAVNVDGTSHDKYYTPKGVSITLKNTKTGASKQQRINSTKVNLQLTPNKATDFEGVKYGQATSTGVFMRNIQILFSATVLRAGIKFPDGLNVGIEVIGHVFAAGGQAFPDYAYGNVKTRLYVQTAGFSCPRNNKTYPNINACNKDCKDTKYKCKSTGQYVPTPNCSKTVFECDADKKEYNTFKQCEENCSSFKGLELASCSDTKSDNTFSLYLKEKDSLFGFDSVIAHVGENDNETILGQEAYGHEELILKQCADRYVNPYLSFTEPGTNAHFQFAYMDEFIFRTAVKNKLIVGGLKEGTMPSQPAVYRGFKARSLDRDQLSQQEDLDEEDTGTRVVTPYSEEVSDLTKDEQSYVPNRPMFLTKQTGINWKKGADERLGLYDVTGTNLIPSIYYYECPDSIRHLSTTNSCGYEAPFGGNADTISGRYCFKHFCDENAYVENTPDQLSGCGMVQDGRFE